MHIPNRFETGLKPPLGGGGFLTGLGSGFQPLHESGLHVVFRSSLSATSGFLSEISLSGGGAKVDFDTV